MVNSLMKWIKQWIHWYNEFILEFKVKNFENYNTENNWNLMTTWYIGTCLITSLNYTVHAISGPNNGMSTLRYWLVLSLIFLTELFLDQVSLSPGFSVLKLLFLVWCVLPIDNNGAMLIYENVKRNLVWYPWCLLM